MHLSDFSIPSRTINCFHIFIDTTTAHFPPPTIHKLKVFLSFFWLHHDQVESSPTNMCSWDTAQRWEEGKDETRLAMVCEKERKFEMWIIFLVNVTRFLFYYSLVHIFTWIYFELFMGSDESKERKWKRKEIFPSGKLLLYLLCDLFCFIQTRKNCEKNS